MYIIVDGYFVGNFGPSDYRSMIASTVISVLLLGAILFSKKCSYYGLKKAKNAKECLYFSPLILIASLNLWDGVIECSNREVIFFVLRMINIGFIEEIICRGFLFRALEKFGTKKAMYLSSAFFGVAHIMNLFFGAKLIPTVIKIFFSTSLGYLYVTIFCKSGSLLPCIISHQLHNSLCVFDVKNKTLSTYAIPIIIISISIFYSIYINRTSERLQKSNTK